MNIALCNDSVDVIVSVTDKYTIDRTTTLAVPHQYRAFIIDDGKINAQYDSSEKVDLFKEYGKGHIIRVAFVRMKGLPIVKWGYNKILVSEKEEDFTVGSHGELEFDIENPRRFLESFPICAEVTIETLQDRIKSIMESVGGRILTETLPNGRRFDESVLNANAETLTKKLFDELQADDSDVKKLGIGVRSQKTFYNIFIRKK